MKLGLSELMAPQDGQLIASFGSARLVKNLDGRYMLYGGGPADHTAAKEWISLFFHEAVPQYLPPKHLECCGWTQLWLSKPLWRTNSHGPIEIQSSVQPPHSIKSSHRTHAAPYTAKIFSGDASG